MNELKNRPLFFSQLKDFFNQHIQSNLLTNQTTAVCYLLTLASKIHKYTSWLKLPAFLETSTIDHSLSKLLQNKDLSLVANTLKAISYYLYGNSKDPFDLRYAYFADFIIANAEFNTTVLNTEGFINEEFNHEVFYELAPAEQLRFIKEGFIPLLHKYYPNQFSCKEFSVSDYEVKIDDHIIINFNTSQITQNGLSIHNENNLPYDLKNNLQLKKILGEDILKVKCQHQESEINAHTIIRWYEKNITLHCYYNEKTLKNTASIEIYLELPDQIRYKYEETATSNLPAYFQSYIAVSKEKDPSIYLYDKNTKNFEYKITKQNLLTFDGLLKLGKINNHNSPLHKNFGDNSLINMLIWLDTNTNQIAKIEFLKHKLTILKNDAEFVVKGFNDARLASSQYIKNFSQSHPFLKVVSKSDKESALLLIHINDMPEVIEIALKKNKLHPKKGLESYIVAKLLLEDNKIHEAEKILFNNNLITSRALDNKEISILFSILNSDYTPHFLLNRLLVHVAYLLFHNIKQFQYDGEIKNLDKETLKKTQTNLNKIFNHYLKSLSHVHPLPVFEELFLLNTDNFQPFFTKRKLELTSIDYKLATTYISPSESPYQKVFSSQIDLHDSLVLNDYLAIEPSLGSRHQYALAKENNTLPFKYYNLEELLSIENKEYLKLMINEIDDLFFNQPKDFTNTIIQRGIYPFLVLLKMCEIDELRTLADALFDRIGLTKYTASEITIPKLTTVKASNIKLPIRSRVLGKMLNIKYLPTFNVRMMSLPRSEFKNIYEQYVVTNNTTVSPDKEILETAKNIYSIKHPLALQSSAVQKEFENSLEEVYMANTMQAQSTQLRLNNEKHLIELKNDLEALLDNQKNSLQSFGDHIYATLLSVLQLKYKGKRGIESHQRSLPTLEQLVILAAKDELNDSENCLKLVFPELTIESLHNLRSTLKEYHLLKVNVQTTTRLLLELDAATTLKDDQEKTEKLSVILTTLRNATEEHKSYNLDDKYALLFSLIEYVLNIQLRPEQVKNVRLLEDPKELKNYVLQMIMGAGKTSVIQPLLAILFAKTGSISSIIVPPAQLKSVTKQLQETLGSLYETYIYVLKYNRELSKDIKYLKNYLQSLKNLQVNGGILITIAEEKQSILASLKEVSDDLLSDATQVKSDSLKELHSTISEIYLLLEQNENLQIDEVDSVLDPKVTFRFPKSGRILLNSFRAILSTKMLINAISHPNLKNIAFNFIKADHSLDTEKIALNKFNFNQIMKPIFKKVVFDLINKEFNDFKKILSNDTNDYIGHFVLQTTPYDDQINELVSEQEASIKLAKALVKRNENHAQFDSEEQLLLDKEDFKTRRDKWIRDQITNLKLKDALAALAHTITLCEGSFLESCGVNYGEDLINNTFKAIPYHASNDPKTTVYSDPYQQIVYTTQFIHYNGISEKGTYFLLKKLHSAILQEIKNQTPLDQIEEYTKLSKIMAEDILLYNVTNDLQEDFIKLFHTKATLNKECMEEFLCNVVTEEIFYYEKNISSSAQSLCYGKQMASYTGTLETGILHTRMTPLREIGTDGKTILSVLKKNKSLSSTTHTIPKKTTLETIENYFIKSTSYMFIDSGGWLKDENIDSFTKTLLTTLIEKRPEIKGVVYHDAFGNIVSLEISELKTLFVQEISLSSLTSKERVVILAQKYETGSNILLPPDAHGMLSIREDMTKRDFLQAIFRLRQILAGQAGDIFITDNVADQLKSQLAKALIYAIKNKSQIPDEYKTVGNWLENNIKKPKGLTYEAHINNLVIECCKKLPEVDIESLYRYFDVNQVEAKLAKNYLAVQQRMQEVIEKPILLYLADPSFTQEDKVVIYRLFNSILLENCPEILFEQITNLSRKMTKDEALKTLVTHYFNQIFNPLKTLSTDSKQQFIHFLAKVYSFNIEHQTIESLMKIKLEDCYKNVTLADVLDGKVVNGSEIQYQVENQVEQLIEQQIQQQVQARTNVKLTQDSYKLDEYTPLFPLYDSQQDFSNNGPIKTFYNLQNLSIKEIDTNPHLLAFKGFDGSCLKNVFDLSSIRLSKNCTLQKDEQLRFKDCDTYSTNVLMIKDSQSVRYVLLNFKDTSLVKKYLEKTNEYLEDVSVTLIDLDKKILHSNKATDNEALCLLQTNLQEDDHLADNLLYLKLILGIIPTARETKTLEKMLNNNNEAKEELSHYFRDTLQHKPDTKKQYDISPLAKLLPKIVESYLWPSKKK